MALRLRRGTDAQRQLITPAEGELIYVTDTKDIYVGDGTTLGGVLVTAGINDLNDLADVNTSGALIGQVLKYDGTNWVASDDLSGGGGGGGSGSISVGADDSTLRIISAGESFLILGGTNISTTSDAEGNITINNDFVQDFAFSSLSGTPTTLSGYGITDALRLSGGTMTGNVNFNTNDITNVGILTIVDRITGDINGKLLTDDSTVSYDNATGNFFGSFFGDYLGSFTGLVEGDLRGSIFLDDSSIVVDGLSGAVSPNYLEAKDNFLSVLGSSSGTVNLNIESADAKSILILTHASDSDLTGVPLEYGSILFQRNDSVGNGVSAVLTGYHEGFFILLADNGNFPESNAFLFNNAGNVGFGTFSPAAKLDVRGNGIFEGDLTAAAFRGSVMADDSSTIIDAVNGNVTASGYVQFGSFTKVERDTLIAANGMVIYNTTSDKFQGYQNGAWINLDDGTLDP